MEKPFRVSCCRTDAAGNVIKTSVIGCDSRQDALDVLDAEALSGEWDSILLSPTTVPPWGSHQDLGSRQVLAIGRSGNRIVPRQEAQP